MKPLKLLNQPWTSPLIILSIWFAVPLFFSVTQISAQPVDIQPDSPGKTILANERLLKDKTVKKIEEMSAELLEKTGIHFRISAVQMARDYDTFLDYLKAMGENTPEPWIVMAVSPGDKKADILLSRSLEGQIDVDRVVEDYMIPILRKPKENSEMTVFSAAVFNGTLELFDQIQKSKNVKLESLPLRDTDLGSNKSLNGFIRGVPILLFILVTIYIIYKNKKRQKQA